MQGVFNFMNNETISLQLVGRNEAVTFHLESISVFQDREYQQRFVELADLSEQERADREYKIYSDALADWSAEMPTRKNGTGEEKPLADEGTPAEAVRAYFADRTNAKEWIAVSALTAFRNSLYPSVNFPKSSAS